jgi:ribokinase
MNNQYDFVAIGDIVIDAFIRLKDAEVNCDINKESCRLSVAFGDKVPYEFVEVVKAVGNCANAAVAASRLGLTTALSAHVGDDQNGKEYLDVLKAEGVSTDLVGIHENKKTNYHYVLWYGDERTILVKHEEFSYTLPVLNSPKWLYLTSLGESAENLYPLLEDFLSKNPETKMAFQPGTFQMKMGLEKLKSLYMRSEIFFCNVEEAKRILKITGDTPIKSLLEQFASLGPKIVVITDGPKGAYCFDGNAFWFMPPYPDPKAPYERTGAGDAFASTFTAALALGKSIPEALAWGPINSMSVVQQIGAQKGLLKRDQLEKLIDEAPETYKVETL